jgi:hypothetical protein
VSDFDAGLAVGWMRGYQAAMDAVALAAEQQDETDRSPWEAYRQSLPSDVTE